MADEPINDLQQKGVLTPTDACLLTDNDATATSKRWLPSALVWGFAITAAEVSAAVIPTDYRYEPGNVLRYGTNTIPGTTDLTTPTQNAIDVLEAGGTGGEVQLPPGLVLITQIAVEQNGITLVGHGAGGNNQGDDQGTTLISAFAGDAVTLGVSGGGRWNVGLRNLRIDISGANSSGVCLKMYAMRNWSLDNVRYVTSQGAGTLTGQTAVIMDGESAFSGWGQWLNCFVKGDFTTGLKLTGTASGNSPNANTFIGGGVFSTFTGTVSGSGSRGVWVEYGTGNAFLGVDLKGFETNIDCDDDDNFFQVRHEQGEGTVNFFDVSGDRNFYISMTHAASGITDTGSENVICTQNGFTQFQVKSAADPEEIRIETTATNGIARLILKNDVQQWLLQCNSNDRFRIYNSTAGKSLFEVDFVGPIYPSYADATRGSAGVAGRTIFNTDDGQLNIDDGANWTLPDGTTT